MKKIFDIVFELIDEKKFNEAYQLALELIEHDNALGNLYIAAQLAIEQHDYQNARNILSLLIDNSVQENNDWFLTTAYLLRSYSLAKIGDIQNSLNDLNNKILDEETKIEGVYWLNNHECVNKYNIMQVLNNSSY